MRLPAASAATSGTTLRPARRRTRRGVAALALAALVVTGLAEAGTGEHRVREGETLSGIAQRYGVSARDLAAANDLSDPNLIVAGTRLVIPGSSAAGTPAASHRIAVGETLSGIAQRYGVSARDLAAANGITDPNLIVVGRSLTIGAGTGSSGSTSSGSTSSGSTSSGSGSAVATTGGQGSGAATGVPSFVPSSRRHLAASFERWGREYGVDPSLLMALAWQESGWQVRVTSSAGAAGVMQIIPATAHFTSVVLLRLPDVLPVDDPDANIRMGARFLRYLLDAFDGDERLALAAYNQGLTSVRRQGPQDAVLRYVDAVQALHRRF